MACPRNGHQPRSTHLKSQQTMANDDRKNEPKVSVIIPAYNAAHCIAETLESVFSQTFTNYEVIVINDGSADTPELEAVLSPYADRIVYVVQPNQGQGGARNTGIHHARGEWLAFLDADDIWLPEYLAEQMKFLDQNPSLDYVIADCESFGYRPPWPHSVWRLPAGCRGPVSFEEALRGKFPQLSSTTVMRKSSAMKAGLLDARLRGSEDFEFFARMAYHGARIDYLHRVLARKRLREGCFVFHPDAWARVEIMALERLGQNLELSPSQHALVQRQIADNEAAIALRQGKQRLGEDDFPGAIKSLREANQFFRDPRITATLIGLRVAPRLTAWIIGRREIQQDPAPSN
jgi:glycosyltransferase involved in cell wall biosynthesis